MSKTTKSIFPYEISENNIIYVYFEIHSEQESEDRLTQAMETTEITKMVLNGENVTDALYDFLHEDIYDKIK